jgi:hypothetical protein
VTGYVEFDGWQFRLYTEREATTGSINVLKVTDHRYLARLIEGAH